MILSQAQVAATSVVFTVLITFGLVVSAISISWRAFRYLRAGRRLPVLLPRDWVLIAGVLIPLLLGFAMQAVGAPEDFDRNAWWVYGRGIFAVLAVLTFAGFEVFVIERVRDGEDDR